MRRGITTVELIVVLTVAGVLSTAIGTLLQRQQRFYMRAALAVEHRISLRDATSILPAELRALSPRAGDVLAFSDSSLEIRATIGGGIVCGIGDGTSIELAPAGSSRGTALAAFSTTPQPRDIALVYDPAVPDDSLDDRWIAREISGADAVNEACQESALVPTDGTPVPRLRLRLVTALPATVRGGTFTHVVRRVRYRLYRSIAGDWYLGHSEWDGTGFSVVQPVSGPFASYSPRSANTGLLLRYFDADGAEVSSSTDVSRITRVEVMARSVAGGGLSTDASTYRDAQDITVRVRNR